MPHRSLAELKFFQMKLKLFAVGVEMENPLTWGPLEHAIHDILVNHERNLLSPNPVIGASLESKLAKILHPMYPYGSNYFTCRCGHNRFRVQFEYDSPLTVSGRVQLSCINEKCGLIHRIVTPSEWTAEFPQQSFLQEKEARE